MWQIPVIIIVYYRQCNCCIGGEDQWLSLIRLDKKEHISPLEKTILKALFILPKNSWLTVGYRIRVKQKVLGLSPNTTSLRQNPQRVFWLQ